MKKISTFLAAILVLISLGNKIEAQNLVTQNATVHLTGPADQLMTAYVTIQNNGSNAVYIKVARISQTLAPNHISYFCWTVCYDPIIDVSPDSVLLTPGSSTSIFNGDVNPLGYPGSSTVTYAFFDANGDSAMVTFNYDFLPTGINELSVKPLLYGASPNPADAVTKISYNLNSSRDAKIVVCNMLGSTVKEIKLNDFQNSLTLSTAEFKQGIYFYTLIVDGKAVSSKKLIVAHH
jgi:hypothetical protein